MSRSDSPRRTRIGAKVPDIAASPFSELTRADIDHYVARGQALRSAYVAAYVRRLAQSWSSVFRRPGRLAVRPGH
ncbi:MAG: hypothetical protein ACFCUO_12880 [Rhodospirillales bacterium]